LGLHEGDEAYHIGCNIFDKDFRHSPLATNLVQYRKEEFMETNQGPIDRIVRSIVGATLVAIVIFSFEGPIALVEGAIALAIGAFGAVTLLTGLIGWCPTYALLGISTCSDERPAR
jgi:DUF2892 family protein